MHVIWDNRRNDDFTSRQNADIETFVQIMLFVAFAIFTIAPISIGIYTQFHTPPAKRIYNR